MTARTSPDDLRRYMEAGMDGCVSKPLAPAALLSTVRAAVPKLGLQQKKGAGALATEAVQKALERGATVAVDLTLRLRRVSVDEFDRERQAAMLHDVAKTVLTRGLRLSTAPAHSSAPPRHAQPSPLTSPAARAPAPRRGCAPPRC